jgi:hypothetical protein
MKTQCNKDVGDFKTLGKRKVVADFSGGTMTSDAGALLLEKTDEAINLLQRAAAYFTDHRKADLIDHTVTDLLRQRIFGLALGYEDLNDHDELSKDPMLATVVGKPDPTGNRRRCSRHKDRPLAGKSTLNRLELTGRNADASQRYKKIVLDFEAFKTLFVDVFLETHKQPPEEIVLDFDATDDPLYGRQEGRYFDGYYKEYCYLPLYVFCGHYLLVAELRTADIEPAKGVVGILEWLIPKIRSHWPEVRIVIRGDSGFCRDEIMTWCEDHSADYVLGLRRNSRLEAEISEELSQAKALWEQSRQASRVFKDFRYRTRESWSCERRVVGKAEHLDGGANPRFVVTSLTPEHCGAAMLYEKRYCLRGEMENRIKEQQLCLFADRTSTATLRANQIRLWFSSLAYTLMNALRRLGLAGTKLARSRCDTIRLRLLKIGAAVRVSVRRIWVAMASSFPNQGLFVEVLRRLTSFACGSRYMPLRC